MFSVIIPYYKKRSYIERCINSVLNQTFQDFEIILVDDGSADDIKGLVEEKYMNKIRLFTQENRGVSAARNTGIAAASHNYIAFLDADDCWSPFYLEKNAAVINREVNIKIIGSHYTRVKGEIELDVLPLEYYKLQNYFKSAIRNTYFTSSSAVIHWRFFKENEGFNSSLKRGEDIDVWLRAVASGGGAYYIKNTIVFYSNEDINQSTASIGNVENALVGIINNYYQREIEHNEAPDFSKFISKYVYFNLYPYYFSKANHNKSKKNLMQNQHYYFFLHLPYYLPVSFGERIVSNKKLNQILRLYLKFFLRKLYA